MKISFNWLKQYIALKETPEELSTLLTNCGLEVSHITNTIPSKDFFKNLVIGQVVTYTKHPNADRLKLLKVNIGLDRDLEIVCGAPNVALGIKVVIAPVGASIENRNGEITHIKSAVIRGIPSEGMACSAYEIGIGKDADGIMILDTTLPNGSSLESYLATVRDVVFDIEITPNRGDACSHIGVARDLCAVLDRDLIYPKVSKPLNETHNKIPIEVIIDKNASCYKYSGVVISGVETIESPQWIKEKLCAIGIQPKNIIVDTTNYVMYETGQPLHAYDYDKIEGKKLYVQPAPLNTSIHTLDSEERMLNSGELVISDVHGPLCIAGVIGGQRAAISTDTSNIFLESARFLPVSVRKSTKAQNIATDASFRFERGAGHDTIYPLQRAIDLITHISGGHIASAILDITTKTHKNCDIFFNLKTLNKISGIEIPKSDVIKILGRLEIEIITDNIESLHLRIPSFKSDVIREIDVVEEVLRIYGFDKIIPQDHFTVPYLDSSDEYMFSTKVKMNINTLLVDNGFYEIRTNPIVNSKYYKDMGMDDSKFISIINPISTAIDSMRPNLVFCGLETILSNRNRQKIGELKFFEFGKVYVLKNKACLESNKLCIWLAGNYLDTSWYEKKVKSSFYDISINVYNILYKLGIKNFDVAEISNDFFANGIEIYVNKMLIASLGRLQNALLEKIDIDETVFYADIDWDEVIKCIPEKITYKSIPKYPSAERDLSILIDSSTNFEKIKQIIQSRASNLIEGIEVIDVYLGEDLPENTKSYSIRLKLQSYDKTLDSKEITALMSDIENSLTIDLNAKIR
jgi:phenylalanyl-tRNA synthetase beta chain